ncbi:MAG: hypothetical protein WBC04_05720 [Candidatus Acidiferrales bacterium]
MRKPDGVVAADFRVKSGALPPAEILSGGGVSTPAEFEAAGVTIPIKATAKTNGTANLL